MKVPNSELDAETRRWNKLRAVEEYPITVVDPAPAVRLDSSMLRASARRFLRFVHEAYGYLGCLGPVRVEARVSAGDSYLAVSASPQGREPRFYSVSEQTELHSSVEDEYQDLASREPDLAEEYLPTLLGTSDWRISVNERAGHVGDSSPLSRRLPSPLIE